MPLTWQKISDYSIQAGPWTLSKVIVAGKAHFELWREGRAAMVGRFATAGEGKEFAEREQARGAAREGEQ